MQASLSEREAKKRDQILNGNIWKVIISLSLPILIFQLFNTMYVFFDAFIVARISENSISAVIYFDQIKAVISSISTGLSIGGCVIVARHFGKNEIQKAKEAANRVFYLMLFISLFIMIFVVFLSKPILLLASVPEELISEGLGYFNIQIITLTFSAINLVYMGIERAKGNIKLTVLLNFLTMIIKLISTTLFVIVFHKGLTFVALSTMIAQMVLFIIAMFIMMNKRNSLRIMGPKKLKIFDKAACWKIIAISFPIFFGKFLFSIGKVMVSSFSLAYYGTAVIGALGIASNIAGFSQLPGAAFEESLPSIVSQNLGNGNVKRALKSTYAALIISVIFFIVVTILQLIFLDFFIKMFADKESSVEYYAMIEELYHWEKYSSLSCGVAGILIGCLFGFGTSKISTYANIFRLFVFRLPAIIILYKVFNVGTQAVGISMFISNGLMMVLVVLYFLFFLYKLKKKDFIPF